MTATGVGNSDGQGPQARGAVVGVTVAGPLGAAIAADEILDAPREAFAHSPVKALTNPNAAPASTSQWMAIV